MADLIEQSSFFKQILLRASSFQSLQKFLKETSLAEHILSLELLLCNKMH